MKLKLLLILCLVSLGTRIVATEYHKKIVRLQNRTKEGSAMTRAPSKLAMQAEDINDCLYLTFRFSLNDADITIIDKYGNEVVKEQKSLIYEGRVITIPQSDGYPYSFEITSSTVNIEGEIVLE